MMDKQRQAYLYGLATVLLWSTVASAFKLTLRYMDHVRLLFYSSLVSCIVLVCILVIRGRLRLILEMSGRDWLVSAGLGLLNPFLYYLVLFKAYDLLPAQQAQPLNYTWAVTLALLSVPLLGQKIGVRALGALLVSYTGVVIISTQGDLLSLEFANPLGVALALGSTVIWALYWICNTRDRQDPVVRLFSNFLFGTFYVSVLTAATTGFAAPFEGLLGAAYVGVFEMGATFVLWLTALKLSKTTAEVGNLIFLSPFLSLVFIHLLVGEEILASTFVGLAFILGGNLIQQLGRSREASHRDRKSL